ncbi:DNA-binding protein [Segatella hominis]|uniref:HU family DNA-binding protein n=1 Tax=Segatella hominis TaxID=2518605 RepID=UPI001C47B05D|nr:DNA-binding protein [Segatella hominis]WOZ82127.1 DNA-binding protein [Segatella hominis]
MILFKLSKNKNPKIQKAYGKYYARPVVTQTIDLNGLAEHMTEHNTGFSPGATKGLLTDMVKCIKELVLQGLAVKIDDLAIFSIGLKTKKGADSEDDFSVAKNIDGVRLRARATGNLTSSKLDIQASLKNAANLLVEDSSKTTTPSGPDGDGSGSGTNGPSKGDSSQTGDNKDNTQSGGGNTDNSQGGGTDGDGDYELK